MSGKPRLNLVEGRQGQPISAPDGPVDIHLVIRQRRKAWRVPELAELLDLGRRTLYDEIERGELAAIRIGTSVRLNPAEVVAWLEARTSGVRSLAA
jgi:excisionase family DNA binding protein